MWLVGQTLQKKKFLVCNVTAFGTRGVQLLLPDALCLTLEKDLVHRK